jgi:hypothetical protein
VPGPALDYVPMAKWSERAGRCLLPEARSPAQAGMAADRADFVPERTQSKHARDRRRRSHCLGPEPRLHRPQPVAGAQRRRRPSRRAARRSRPNSGHPVLGCVQNGTGCSRRARGARSGRVAEDLGKARHACVCPDRAALELHTGETSGTRVGTRGRAPYGRACDDRVVEGGATRRLRRLQPECTRPHHRIRIRFAP